MALYSVTNKGNVIQCKWNCKVKHEHFQGTYERAVKYFAIDEEEIKSYGNLLNIIIYHQTSDNTVFKFSNELYSILVNAMSEHKYWVPSSNRHNEAIKLLEKARDLRLTLDDKLYKRLSESENKNSQKRAFLFKSWGEKYGF